MAERRQEPTRPANPLERVSTRHPAAKLAPAGVFGYAAGKSIIAKKLVKLFPEHKTYTEPFAGSAALFFTKSEASKEVLNDRDEEVAFALKSIQSFSKSEIAELAAKDWKGNVNTFAKVRAMQPTNKVDRLYKFLYLVNFSYGKNRKSFNGAREGGVANAAKRVERCQPRISKAIITCGDYEKPLLEHDEPGAFHFLDPPYGGYDVQGIGEKEFDESRFRKLLEGLKGRFLVTYGTKGALDTNGFEVKRMRQVRQIRHMRGGNDDAFITHLLISNFKVAQKSIGSGIEIEDLAGSRKSVSIPEEIKMRSEPTVGTAQIRFLEKSCELDLCFGNEAWTFIAQRSEVKEDPLVVTKNFSVNGSRHFLALTEGVRAAEMKDSVAETVVKFDKPVIESGIQTETFKEFFLSKGDEMTGVLQLKFEPGVDAQYPWLATFVDRFPAVLYDFTVLKSDAPMPAEGASALPSSLEQYVPIEMRFWTMKGEEARKAREALSKSRILAAENIAIVDGTFEHVTYKMVLSDQPVKIDNDPAWLMKRAAEILPEDVQLVEIFSPDRDTIAKVEGIDPVIFCDAGDAIDGSIELLAKALDDRNGHYLITAIDSSETRRSLEKLGRVFKFAPGPVDSVNRIFVASFPVRADVEWIGKSITCEICKNYGWDRSVHKTVFKDGAPHHPACKAVQSGPMSPSEREDYVREGSEAARPKPKLTTPEDDTRDIGKDDLSTPAAGGDPAGFLRPAQGNPYHQRDRYKAIDMHLVGKAGDEQIVYGIVLEPDTVDAQADVYSADAVRDAAHKYMADFQNTGLMHQRKINEKAQVIESFLAPCDFDLGGQKVKKGTWCMVMRVLDKALWSEVKAGKYTGFSIGGSAQRTPEPTSKAMRKTQFQGMPITIDRPKGYIQTGRDANGASWEREYKVDYGYIPRTKGGDGEGLDVFLGPDPNAPNAFWFVQHKGDGKTFDEYKVVLGASDEAAARKIYTDHIPEKYMGECIPMSVQHMKALLNKEPEHKMQPEGPP